MGAMKLSFPGRLSVSKAFVANEIVPDVESQAPKKLVTVEYAGGLCAKLGNELAPQNLTNAPKLWWDADKRKKYTVAMTDPDAPSREDPNIREWLHWLIVNVPGTDLAQGDELIDYMGPAPPQGTGFHRYTFLVYAQKEGTLVNVSQTPAERASFHTREFAKEINAGPPLAGNFFNAQYDG
ncbi:hypothetical protein niasHT_017405 [Heterodera trifolii]|uniref:Phosphatidylethanolamine-binding protein n=2 Tax=Heterodera trifolii TaxID=157864 RepID=A0ABD2KXB9_9BILA